MSSHGAPLVMGYDGSEQSRDAAVLTTLLAGLLDAEVIALSILTYAPTEANYIVYERMLREEQEQLVADARIALESVPKVEALSVPGVSPQRELHDMAEARNARLIVIGSTHRGPLGRVLPGTVADRLLVAAPCPIAVAPRGYRDRGHSLESIAIAFDGSPESGLALAMGVELAAAAGAAITLIAIADPHRALTVAPGAGGWAGMVSAAEGIERERQRMRTTIDDALTAIPEPIRAKGEVTVDTDPASAIVTASQGADLLVLGSRGYGPFRRVLLGGVSSVIIREAACPVIVTTRPSAPEAEMSR